MSVNRGMDKEGVVHTHDGISLSHEKEQNRATCRDVDRPRDCLTESSGFHWRQHPPDALKAGSFLATAHQLSC